MAHRLPTLVVLFLLMLEIFPVQAATGNCLSSSGQDAVILCTEAIKAFPDNKPVRVLALRRRAIAYIELQNYGESRRDMNEVISSGLAIADDWWIRGVALSWLGEWELALKDHEVANNLIAGRVEFQLELAAAQLSTNRFDEAEKTYTSIIAKNPHTANYFAARGNARYSAGKYEIALDDYTAAIVYNAVEPEYRLRRGWTREALGNLSSAVGDYTKAVELKSDYREARIARAAANANLGKFDAALTDYNYLIKSGSDPALYLARASVHIHRNDLGAANNDIAAAGANSDRLWEVTILRGRIHAAQYDFEGAIRIYDGVPKGSADYQTANYWRSVAHYSAGNNQDAYEGFSRAVEAWPNEAGIRIDRANSLLRLNKMQEARADLNHILKSDPYNPMAFEFEARLLNTEFNWESSISSSSKALSYDATSATSYYTRAYAKWALGDLEGAAADYAEAIRLEPKFVVAFSERSEVLAELKLFSEAHREVDIAIRLEPKLPEHLRRLGRVYEWEGKLDEALSTHQKSIDMAPEDWWGYEGRAWVKLWQGKWKEARDDCQVMIDKMPKEPAGYRCMAHVKLDIEDKNGALKLLDQASAVNPKYAAAHFDRGMVFYHQGDYAASKANFTKAIALNFRLGESLLRRGDTLRNLNLDTGAMADYKRAQKYARRELADAVAKRISSLQARTPILTEGSDFYPQVRKRLRP